MIQDIPAKGCVNGEILSKKFDKGTGIKKIAEYFKACEDLLKQCLRGAR